MNRNPHQIHDQNCRIVRQALEQSGYRCAQPETAVDGVDIIATPVNGGPALNVRVRSRLYFDKKDLNKNRHIAFPDRKANGAVRLYSPDKLLREAEREGRITRTKPWIEDGVYHRGPTPGWALDSPHIRTLGEHHPEKDAAPRPAKIRPSSPVAPATKPTPKVKTAFARVAYGDMNARQQESYNYHKVAAALSDYGFNAIRLDDDWEGADFIAVHIDGKTMLRVQLKGRFGFHKKYRGKNLWIAFRDYKSGEIYIYPHDELLLHYIERFEQTSDWRDKGRYHFPSRTPDDEELLVPYRLTPNPQE